MEHPSKDACIGKTMSPITAKSKRNYQNSYSIPVFVSPKTANIPQAHDQQHENDFFKSIQGFLIVGKVIGVLPFCGTFGKSWKDLSFRKKSLCSMMSYGIVLVLIFNVILGFLDFLKVSKRNTLDIAHALKLSAFNIWGCLIYITLLYNGQKFLHIFKVWTTIRVLYSRKDDTLRRDTLIITGGIFTSALLESLVLNLEYFKGLDDITGYRFNNAHDNMSTLEAYYWRAHYHWASRLGYNWILVIFAFFGHNWTMYAWNYMDIAIAVFGRAMYFRFKCLYEEAAKKLLPPEKLRWIDSKQGICDDHLAWVQVVHDHENLCKLLEVLENLFSSLVFASYFVNTYFICMKLLEGLTSELSSHSVVHSIFLSWSFLHLVMRTFVVSICCARINVYAHKIRHILQECPLQHYSAEVSRVYIQVTAGPNIGLTGLGCYTITKPFVLGILSVVFSFEIVLLQSVH